MEMFDKVTIIIEGEVQIRTTVIPQAREITLAVDREKPEFYSYMPAVLASDRLIMTLDLKPVPDPVTGVPYTEKVEDKEPLVFEEVVLTPGVYKCLVCRTAMDIQQTKEHARNVHLNVKYSIKNQG